MNEIDNMYRTVIMDVASNPEASLHYLETLRLLLRDGVNGYLGWAMMDIIPHCNHMGICFTSSPDEVEWTNDLVGGGEWFNSESDMILHGMSHRNLLISNDIKVYDYVHLGPISKVSCTTDIWKELMDDFEYTLQLREV